MNRLELRTLVIGNTGRSDRDAYVNAKLNVGLMEIAKLWNFRAMRSEADLALELGGDSVDLPSGCKRVVFVQVVNGVQSYNVELKSKHVVMRMYPNVSELSMGLVHFGYVDGSKLKVAPRSQQAVGIRLGYYKWPLALAGDSSVVSLTGLEYALECWTTAEVFDSIEQFESAQVWRNKFRDAMGMAIRMDQQDANVLWRLGQDCDVQSIQEWQNQQPTFVERI